MPRKAAAKKSPMSAQHKEALAVGRDQGRAVRKYLEALEANKPRRGRKRTPESIKKRLGDIEGRLATADPLSRVNLIQERINLQRELEAQGAKVDMAGLEKAFLKAAKEYGSRKGISYAAWREAGVDAAVLKKAGIGRSAG